MKYRVYSVYLEPLHLVPEDKWQEFENELDDAEEQMWTIEAQFDNHKQANDWLKANNITMELNYYGR